MPSSSADEPQTATWSSFVERFGVTSTCGLIATIATIAAVQSSGNPVLDGAAEFQLLFLFIAMGCMAVLSFRDPVQRSQAIRA